jgi:hypothetical protein
MQNAFADLIVFIFEGGVYSTVRLAVCKTAEMSRKALYRADLVAVHVQFYKLGCKRAINIFAFLIDRDPLYMTAAINTRADDLGKIFHMHISFEFYFSQRISFSTMPKKQFFDTVYKYIIAFSDKCQVFA